MILKKNITLLDVFKIIRIKMRKVIMALCFLAFGYAAKAQEIKDWENPQVVGINKEPYHTTP